MFSKLLAVIGLMTLGLSATAQTAHVAGATTDSGTQARLWWQVDFSSTFFNGRWFYTVKGKLVQPNYNEAVSTNYRSHSFSGNTMTIVSGGQYPGTNGVLITWTITNGPVPAVRCVVKDVTTNKLIIDVSSSVLNPLDPQAQVTFSQTNAPS